MDMSDTIIVAIIGLVGSGLGSLIGVVASSKLTQYRIQKLEEQVNKHNNLVERMTVNEMKIKNIEERMRCKEAKYEQNQKNV
jgi:ABC-type lipoprotein release transport system permease subunit